MAAPVFEKGHYHWQLQTVQRSQGYAVTVGSAYRTGSLIVDERTGVRADYRERLGVTETLILLPPGAPERFFKREVLWNEAEKREKRKDAVTGREINIGLPHQLSPAGRRRAALLMAQYLIDHYGVAVEISFHDPSGLPGHDPRNFHCHIMFSSRAVTPDGFGEKTRILDVKTTSSEEVRKMRKAWEDFANAELEREGINVRIDCRSLKDQGITDRLPQIHEGVVVRAMLDRGVDPAEIRKLQGRDNRPSDQDRNRAEFNAEIIDLNERRALEGPLPLEVQIKNLERLIEVLLEKITDLESLIPRSLLPEWVRRKVERAWLKAIALMERWRLDKEEAEEEREKREGIHAQMRRIREELKRLQQEKAHKVALQRLYMRIEAKLIMTPWIKVEMPRPPPRELTNHQYNQELKLKAETARARVLPEYRPRLPVKDVVWDVQDKQPDKLSHSFQNVVPIDNGGRAKPPPPITREFNSQAQPAPHKQKIEINFATQRI